MALLAEDSEELLRWSVARMAEGLDAERCYVFRRSDDGADLDLVARTPETEGPSGRDLEQRLFEHARRTLEAHRHPAATGDGPAESQPVDVVTGSLSLVSLIIRGTVAPYGVLTLQRNGNRDFDHGDVELLRSIANVLSTALERLQREVQLQRSQQLNRAVIDAFPGRLALLDGEGRLLRVNRRWRDLADQRGVRCEPGSTPPLEELAGRLHPEGDPDRRQRIFDGIHEVLIGRRPSFAIEYPTQQAEDLRWCLLRVVPLFDRQGALLVHEDVTERRLFSERLAYQAQHDRLTGLPNRHLFADRLEQGLLRAQRSGQGLGILFLDIDRFKRINDTLGHAFGDEVLRRVARRLRRRLQETDTLARVGADEFVAIVAVEAGISDAVKVAHALLEAVREPMVVDDQTVFLAATVGISLYPDDGDDPATLLHKADSALYRAKSHGLESIQSFSTEMSVEAIARFELESHLRLALGQDQLSLHFQPQFDAERLRITGVEALLRWQHPERGPIPPGKFVPLAEESDLILELGDWVLRQGCRQLAQWRGLGLGDVRLAINVSALQLARPEFLGQVEQALEDCDLPPTSLELEVTESVLLIEGPQVTRRLQELRGLGVSVSIDDFGTGYSSLAYLQSFPLDRLKVDRRFIDRLDEDDAASLALVRSIIGLGHGLGMKVVAEGVEREDQLGILRRLGCDSFQGFLLGRPQPPETLWLELEPLCRPDLETGQGSAPPIGEDQPEEEGTAQERGDDPHR
ncbi:MAG: EAL domain-containing protein [Acidobacteria bacterium]|nr:EAL domain-containing protein [Acidobacteriota bacterium]